MKKVLKFSMILLVIAVAVTSCKKQKITKDQWFISLATDLQDGSNITSDYSGEVWEFEKDGTYRENGNIKGTWEFTSKKEYLTITKSNSGGVDNLKILKLKKKEMWLEDVGNEELHLSKY